MVKNLLRKTKEILALGVMVAGLSVVPSFADEVQETVLENTETAIETIVESTIETTEEEDTRVEDSASSQSDLEAVIKELEGKTFSSKEELEVFCKENGYSFTRNKDKDSLNGESYFFILVCGTEAKAEVVVIPVVDGVKKFKLCK